MCLFILYYDVAPQDVALKIQLMKCDKISINLQLRFKTIKFNEIKNLRSELRWLTLISFKNRLSLDLKIVLFPLTLKTLHLLNTKKKNTEECEKLRRSYFQTFRKWQKTKLHWCGFDSALPSYSVFCFVTCYFKFNERRLSPSFFCAFLIVQFLKCWTFEFNFQMDNILVCLGQAITAQ